MLSRRACGETLLSVTARYRPLPPITDRYRPLPPLTAPYHPLASVTACNRPLPPATARYCPLPSATARYRPSSVHSIPERCVKSPRAPPAAQGHPPTLGRCQLSTGWERRSSGRT